MFASRTAIHLRPRGPKPRALKTELRSDEIGALDGTCTHTLPADNGLLFYSATRAKWLAEPKPHLRLNKVRLRTLRFDATAAPATEGGRRWWEALVTLQFVASGFVF